MILRFTHLILIVLIAVLSQSDKTSLADEIEFNRDIRPILSDRCFQCHGPDEKKRESDLRFDLESDAKKDLGGYHAIVGGDVAGSAMVDRILSDDPDERMPPAESGKSLSQDDVELLKRWIASGANFQNHWSFQKPMPAQPRLTESDWVRNDIDSFVLAKLQSKSLSPSKPADRNTLIRRLSIDLLGLPPTPAEVAAFLGDPSDDAYENLVDRLLASKHYGERIGRHWLDLARYADSNGYANDGVRSIWPYRDWVVNALNNDMPFDQFTIEQLAGDLLPGATSAQRIATGFHRNTPLQTEGGSDAEQYRVERTKNRTDTTGAVWLGLTVGCAQCHTHKFDPITHQEYYQLYAFFNNADEPKHTLSSPEIDTAIADLKRQIVLLDERIAAEKSKSSKDESSEGGSQQWTTLTWDVVKSEGGAMLNELEDGSILVSGKNPFQDTYTLVAKLPSTAKSIRIETLTHKSLPKNGPGRAGNGNFVLAELVVTSQESVMKIVDATADHSQKGYSVLDAFDGTTKTGWAINVSGGNMNVDRTAIFALANEIEKDIQLKITTYDQGNGYNIGRFRVSTSKTTPPKTQPTTVELQKSKKGLQEKLKQVEKTRPTTLVMSHRAQPRRSFVQIRGDFLDPGPDVKPATFSVLHPLKTDPDQIATRLDLAHWLMSPENPLTSRVQVNRIWQHMFGVGLVETENDFGYQGSLPSHPELLDYLATDLMDGGWKLKRLYKKIAMSATYRQSSIFREELYAVDPKNRWLGKQNRFRVEGEIVRDLGLTASGLMSRKMGGPATFPPIPPNVIGTSSAKHRWPESKGEDRYRRGIYTAIYRANVYPMLLAFDGPDRDNACTRRSRSNTPLQALTIANDAAFIEMAQAFGQQMMALGENASVEDRIQFGFMTGLSREASRAETRRLADFQASRLEFYQSHPEETAALAGNDSAELASWIAVARVIMNLDEFITRE